MSSRILFLILLNWTLLNGQVRDVIDYQASYLGISLLDMRLTWVEDDSTVQITYNNQLKPFIARFHTIHNIYKVKFLKENYYPLAWSKQISEGDLNFHLGAELSRDGRAVLYSNQRRVPFPEGAFTVFSATHFLASKAGDPDFFPATIQVFIDGEIWDASVSRYTSGRPHPKFMIEEQQVLIQADLLYGRGQRVMPENDILMQSIASKGSRFLLWVEPDGSYSKAQFGEFPKAVVLERVKN